MRKRSWTCEGMRMRSTLVRRRHEEELIWMVGIAGLEAASRRQDRVLGVQLLNISLRMLHEKKQAPLIKPLVAALQYTLRETPLGEWFFTSVAKPEVLPPLLAQPKRKDVLQEG